MKVLIRFFFAAQPVGSSCGLSRLSSSMPVLSWENWGLGPCASSRADHGVNHPGVWMWEGVGGGSSEGIGIDSWSPVSGSFSRLRVDDPEADSFVETCSQDIDFSLNPFRIGLWDDGLLLRRSEYWSRTRGRVNDHHRDAPSGFVWNDIESEVFGGDCALYAAGLSCEEDATTSSWGDGGSSLAHAAGRKVS